MSNLKAVLTFDDSWDDEAVRNAFADNDQFPGVTVAEVTFAECGKCARQIKGSADQQSASPTNSDYTAALNEEIQLFLGEESFSFTDGEILNLAARLNSVVKAQQNCA